MTQNELNRAVAKATGESVATIAGMGFVTLTPVPHERDPRTINWDEIAGSRHVSLERRRKRTSGMA